MGNGKSGANRWAVILAGGEGIRLRPVTRLISGDDRPKQFCNLLGERSLLAETRSRAARVIPEDQTLLVVTKPHARFYLAEVENVPPFRLVEQPANRGTLPAILWSLMRLARFDEQAMVVFFPSDHYYEDDQRFVAKVNAAFESAADSRSVVLLAAEPTRAETEYGWIEPRITKEGPAQPDQLRKVKRFWEKPAHSVAQRLLERGCLWNTLVMVGQIQVFLDLIRTAEPQLYEALETIIARCKADMNVELMTAIYDELDPVDFSQRVLARSADKLSMLSLGDLGWSDLGDPRRALTTLSDAVSRKPAVQPLLSTLAYFATAG